MCLVTSLPSVTQPLDHWQFQEDADSWVLRAVPSDLLCSFTRILSPFLVWQIPSKLSSIVLLQRAFSASSCLPLASRAIRSAVLGVNILPFVAWEVAESANLSNSPEEQADLVTHLHRLLLNDKAISSYNSPLPWSQLQVPSLHEYEESQGLSYSAVAGLGTQLSGTEGEPKGSRGSATSLLVRLSSILYFNSAVLWHMCLGVHCEYLTCCTDHFLHLCAH